MRVFIFALMALPAAALAQDFDGRYHPEGQRGWLCDEPSLGMDGGALAIRDGELIGVETVCKMTNPVSVRDMDAVLYDLECMSEGESSTERLLVARSDTGVILLRNGFAAHWTTCE